ncbi:MAG: hypothetical protein ACRDX8_10510 [Acidimicrobiales bacterium]
MNEDCRHYVMQSVGGQSPTRPRRVDGGRARSGSGPSGAGPVERVERCRIEANQSLPFACPEGCLFYEPRGVSNAGWIQPPKGRGPRRSDGGNS